MSLLALAKKAAAIGFVVAGDVKKPVTVYAVPTPTYDSTANATVTTWGTTKTVQGLLYEQTDGMPNAPANVKQRKCLIQGGDFTGVAVGEDSELDAEGFRWKVWRVTNDPAGAVLIIDLYR